MANECACGTCENYLEKSTEQGMSIAVLKTRMDETKASVDELKKTHLPNIYESLNKINIKLVELGKNDIWSKLKTIVLIIASGIIGSMSTYIFLSKK